MVLLQWCTLEPSGKGGLAAIRFSSPVHVKSIRIFPTDAKPFSQCPDVVSRTEPRAFFLDVYFNAHVVTSPNAKEKPKPSNALVPTSIAYSGGWKDFTVDMGLEYATRLMIVRGSFESVSMAIYGELVSDTDTTPTTYEPRPLPSVSPVPLAPSLDPATARDPTQLARQLLKLIPDAPELELVIRLVFCLKPPNDDWDLPEFPYLHPDLDEEMAEFDLEKAFRLTTRPVPDNVSSEAVSRFAERVARCINPKDRDASQAYLVAGLLCHTACQHPSLARSLLDAIDLSKVFDLSTLEDETTLLRLVYATSNIDVAKRLDRDWFHGLASSISNDPNNNHETRAAAKQLIARIHGWTVLEDTFSNTQGDFLSAARMLQEVGTEEQSFGIWLESMIAHNEVVSSLAENPVLPVTLPHLLSHRPTTVTPSQDEFVAFVRAFVGVACVMAVYSWSDSLPDERCRARTLGVLRLWQGVDGYREIVNHFLLLRQMTFRLECMMDLDPPTQSGIDAEHILVNLAKNPRAILRSNLVKCILNVGTLTSYIADEERVSMRQAAFVVDDGFSGAVDELLRPLERPPTFGSLRTLRVALAYIERELDEDEDFRVLDDFWEEANCSLTTALCDLLVSTVAEIRTQFSLLQPPPRIGQDVMAHLFWTADDILRLLLRLVPTFPLPSRLLRTLTANAADLFACADAADMLYAQSSQPSVAAQCASQSCIDIVRILAEQDAPSSEGKPGAQVVLRSLLDHGLHSGGLDPTHHLLQVFCLLNYLLPAVECTAEQRTLWINHVIPMLLPDLSAFSRALDTENKVHFVRRLAELDQGAISIGEWLLLEEIKAVSSTVQSLRDDSLPMAKRRIAQSQVALFFKFFTDVLQGPSANWVMDGLVAAEEAPHILASTIVCLLDLRLSPPHLGEVVEIIAAGYEAFDNELRFALVSALWRSLQAPELTTSRIERRLQRAVTILATITPSYLDPTKVTREIGRLVVELTEQPVSLEGEASHALVSLLEWVTKTATTIPRMADLQTISSDQFTNFRDRLSATLPADWAERLEAVSCEIVCGSSTSTPPPKTTELPDRVELSIHDLEDLLRQHTPAPSTPPRRVLNQDVFGLVTVSPSALLHSPAATGLTKTYSNNDFRQLRQSSARANTSRLPSMHVDVGVAMVV
ncbi:hypothetical protein L226DRAFT_453413 [Lentinus tigrinus ALCF2SS1-7]|uniref:Virilizer N-terminal domain-containing protein n=1 Tax=Lentinus tigrinus ALCF2SS1-6 TaxID=1328759 RepID=A0A5C2SUM4_9APHY|nr:hypothetical protein L227DRAFT_490894 [Lentinus tigrinus ALCF2SS1-6]RPD80762.1 hypothetical protein L226DRAFT_453413 [Lentinus tigrinus ALCF2SS1-7]